MSESAATQKSLKELTATAHARVISLLALAAFLFSLCFIFVGFHHTIYDFHGFRQAQTAISAEYMRDGSFFHYETPVLGPPWFVPFEFPLYQWIVASIADHFSTKLDETGRAISILFFYLSFFPLASILRRLRFRPIQIAAILALVAVSPLYIFVSRLFMIESTALFLSLVYVDQVFRMTLGEKPWRYRNAILAAIFGVLAGVVKITTFAPYFVLGAGVAAFYLWKSLRTGRLRATRSLVVIFCCGVLPVVCTSLWTRFADAEKAKNPLSIYMTSSALHAWNFGTLAQRLYLPNYERFWDNSYAQIGSLLPVALVVVLYAVLIRRWDRFVLICLALYAGTIMLFFNLHFVHVYYSYSVAIFLVVAIGMLIAAILTLPGWKAWLGVGLLALEMFACIRSYHGDFYPLQAQNAPGHPAAAAIIDKTTAKDDVLLITGLDWSSELPYQSHRRAIMDAHLVSPMPTDALGPLTREIDDEGPQTIPEVIACNKNRNSARLQKLLQLVDIAPTTSLHADDCDIYVRGPR
jgi:hypothetical protein